MTERLDELFRTMCEQLKLKELETCVEENHQILIKHLSKADRKVALRMLDAQQTIGLLQTQNAFAEGFKLGLELTTELQNYNDYSLEIENQDYGQFFMSHEATDDEKEN